MNRNPPLTNCFPLGPASTEAPVPIAAFAAFLKSPFNKLLLALAAPTPIFKGVKALPKSFPTPGTASTPDSTRPTDRDWETF